MLSVTGMRPAALVFAATAGLVVLQPSRALAEWWSHAPADFEECADAADKLASKPDKTAALAKCNARFAGRRKPGGGYTYYDFLQDRSFDIAGPNPTPEEQKYIDQQYTLYLAKQRHDSIVAAFSAKQQQQQQQLQQASLRTSEPAPKPRRVPLPTARPAKLQAMPLEARFHGKAGECGAKRSFSCQWPRLSGTLDDLKKLFNLSSSSKTNVAKAKKG
jgi:hypothetical protein